MNDLISRQEAIDLFPNDALEWDTNCGYIAPHFARRMIEELPSADAEPVRHDRWVEEVTDDGKGFPRTEYTCPFCQYKTRADTNYCPECGARLSEE